MPPAMQNPELEYIVLIMLGLKVKMNLNSGSIGTWELKGLRFLARETVLSKSESAAVLRCLPGNLCVLRISGKQAVFFSAEIKT